MVDDPLAALIAAQADLDQARADTAAAQERRDTAMRQARDAGVTWASIQQATGLGAAAVAKALNRSS